MSNTINSLSAIYQNQIAEDEDRIAITPQDQQAVGQHVRAIKYEARKTGEPINRAYNTYVGKHNLTATQRRITKEKLGLAEDTSMPHVSKNDQKAIKARAKGLFKKDLKGTVSGVNETLSNWREDFELREIDMPSTGLSKKKRPRTQERSSKEITDKVAINNKVVINPTMSQLANSFNHEIGKMGGQLVEVAEVEEATIDQVPPSPQELVIQRRMANLNIRLARKNREKLNKISPETEKKKKVEEEVGISSTEKIRKALKDAALRRKEQQKVAKKKEVKEELSDRAKKEVERDAKNVDNPLYKPGRRTVKQLAYARDLALKKKKVVDEKLDYDPMKDPDFDPIEAEKNRGVSGKNNPKKGKKLKDLVKVDEEKKALPKVKMYRKAGNLARAGDEKSMKRQTKIVSTLNKETEKGYKKAALDKLRDGGSPKHQRFHTTEDKAFANVVAALKKKHGDSAVLSSKKDFERAKAKKPQTAKQIQQKDDRSAAQREVDAQYGRTPWNKKGSLGT